MKKIFYTILFLLVVGGISGSYFGSIIFVKNLRADRAVVMSEKFVRNLFSEYTMIGQNCQGEDTNGDSYVSCDIRIQKGNDISTEKVLNLSCPTMWKSYTGSTCKERPVFQQAN